jgi:hypothetical protein
MIIMENLLRAKVEEFLVNLDRDEFINITSMMSNETGKQRIIDTVIDKVLKDKLKIEDAVTDIEISLYN